MEILQSLLNDTKLIDYKFLFLTKPLVYISNNKNLILSYNSIFVNSYFFYQKLNKKNSKI